MGGDRPSSIMKSETYSAILAGTFLGRLFLDPCSMGVVLQGQGRGCCAEKFAKSPALYGEM